MPKSARDQKSRSGRMKRKAYEEELRRLQVRLCQLQDWVKKKRKRIISPTPHFVSFAQAVLFRGADFSLVWRPLLAMLIIGSVYFVFAMSRFRRVIFGG